MSRNGSGTYSLPAGNPVTTGTTISSTWANNTLNDMASALTTSIAYDGQTVPVANLPMGGNVHTGVGNATARTNYASGGDVQDGTLTYLTGVSGTDTITAIGPISMTAYATGQILHFTAAGNTVTAGSFVVGQTYIIVSVGTTDFTLIGASANTVGVSFTATGVGTGTGTASGGNISTTVTLNVNSIGAKSVTKLNGAPLAIGDIPSGAVVTVAYDGTKFQIQTSVGVTSFSGGATGLTPATATSGAVTLAGVLGKLNGGTGALTATITQVARATNVVTITTASAHNFAVSDYVTVAAVTNTGFNGNFTITAVTSTTFSYAQTGSNVTATADTGKVTDLSYVNLATNVTGTLYPNFGGTGTNTLNAGGLVTANNTSAMTAIVPFTIGQVAVVTSSGSVTAGSFVIGSTYTITSVGTTSFTAIGAASNTVGVSFTATGVGSGTGTATLNSFTAGSSVKASTAVASTSGTAIDFTSIPSYAKRITVMFNAVSTSGTSVPIIQIGTSSGPTVTGYNGTSINSVVGGTLSGSTSTIGFPFRSTSASASLYGSCTISNLNGNNWVCSGVFNDSSSAIITISGGVTLAATLDRVRLTTTNGTDTFDAGSINILYE